MGVTCLACGQENREGRKFCAACGARLALTCPGCGSGNEPGEQYCGECGAALAAEPGSASAGSPARREPEGERKQVTVLFADVQGSMTLQEDLDVEAWTRIVDRFVHILADGVRRFGGTVDKFTGDGIMALFGAPDAQEDHARRACHAAWHLARAIHAYAEELRHAEGVDLHMRVGLNSGEVVVARPGEDLRLDRTAHGHTVGLAQRMEALAVPGSAYLTEHTARLVEGWFRLRDLGPMTVKGAREPVRVFVLEGPAPPRSKGGRATSRLVGRASEMARLEEALTRAAEGQAQVVGVVGEPGVGKSRLCDEFARSVLARGITVRRAAGVSHGREVPLLPMLALLRDYFGITEADSPVQARERVSDRLLGLGPDLRDDLPLLFDFLEIPDPERPALQLGAEARMRRVFEVLRRATARRSERELLVVVIEDLHWFDPQSGAFLARLIENFPGSRTLVVTNFRPEFSADWMRHSYYQQISLAPLSPEAVAEMLTDLLGDDASLAPLPAYLVERTGGNPFFVEEVVRALVEDGTLAGEAGTYRLTRPLQRAGLPPSVQAVLAARIDRLGAEHKPVLQSAAVIGRTFAEAVLARVVGQAVETLASSLSALCAAELLQEAQRYPVAEYRFWHALTQEVAYGTLLSGRRAHLHAVVAEALIELDADHLDEEAAVVAWHWERAERPLEAARWNVRAAGFALRSDIGEALRRWRVALDLLERVEESRESLELRVGAIVRLIRYSARAGIEPEEADRLETRGVALAERLGNARLTCMMVFATGVRRFVAGDLVEGRARFLEAERRSEGIEDPDLKVAARFAAFLTFVWLGPLAEGVDRADRLIALCAGNAQLGVAFAGYSVLAQGLNCRAWLLALAGRLGDARADVESGVALARPRSDWEPLCLGLSYLPILGWLGGDGVDASPSADEATHLAEETGNVFVLVASLAGLAVAHLSAGRTREAAAVCERALTLGRQHRSGLHSEASLLAWLALARLVDGDLGAAAVAADEAVAVARGRAARVDECFALLIRGRVAAACGLRDQALADLDAAHALVGDVGALTYEPFIREELGRLHADSSELEEAARLYTSIGATGHARRLASELIGSPATSTTAGQA